MSFTMALVFRDHPRVCGEQLQFELNTAAKAGSSPRVRGAGDSVVEARQPAGIIPACAGSRVPPMTLKGSARDHPRVCGEQASQYVDIQSGLGSSPRVRGADLRVLQAR